MVYGCHQSKECMDNGENGKACANLCWTFCTGGIGPFATMTICAGQGAPEGEGFGEGPNAAHMER